MPGVSTLVREINAGSQLNARSFKRVGGGVAQNPHGARSSACSVNLPLWPPCLVPVKSFAKTRHVR